ncbi:MAG: tetratricopeptide repeat protein [Hyphomonadaceae bacterium]|nr:tetratricopeptide repeat protein [Hyphomonadaceae bacterium]
MPKTKTVLLGAAIALMTSCTTSTAPNYNSDYGLSPAAMLYGDYLAASYASYANDAEARSNYYSRAFARQPSDVVLGRKAMAAALNAGNYPLARTLAIEVSNLDKDDGLSRTILGSHSLAKGQYADALEILGESRGGPAIDDVNSMMRGWSQYGLGNTDAALNSFKNMRGGKYFELLGTLQSAKLNSDAGQFEAADTAFAEINEVGISAIETVLSESRSFVKRGNPDKALKKLQKFAEESGGVVTGPARLFLDALEKGEEIDTDLTPAEQASRALTEPAFGYYGQQRQYEAAELFLRTALELDPKNDKARLFLGSVLEDIERTVEAEEQYGKIAQDSPYTVSARLSEANIKFDSDADEEGIEILENIYKTHPSKVTKEAIGRAYLILEDYESALPYYDALIATMPEEELEKNPMPKYLRGICLERLGRWEEAVDEFEFVLKHQPDNADALNYLGYTWVDKGVNLNRAFTMIRKAVELEPQSGAIIDSLGWAHYKLGQYSEARIQLENAAERSPSSATIIDHLGDVYWKLGRHREAGYQWERALELDPTDKERAAIKAKLKGGLSAAPSNN